MRYMNTAGDQDCLGWDTGAGVTILQRLIQTGLEMNATFSHGRTDGLLDVGAGTGKMLEIEEDDYQVYLLGSPADYTAPRVLLWLLNREIRI